MSGQHCQDYRKESQRRRFFRRLANLPFGAVGLKVSRRVDEWEGWRFADLSPADKELIRSVSPYTMTSVEGLCELINAVSYVVKEQIPGEIVECGVWRGGSMAAAAMTLTRLDSQDRHLYLFDTFEGMPQPGARDINWEGEKALDIYRRRNGRGGGSDWCYAAEEEVARVMSACGYDQSKIHLVKGRVEETVPAAAPERISILRLDTDLYESTRHELEHLFPRLVRGGVLIIDDYGHWRGAREATDEYLSQHGISIFLHRVDYTVRVGVKM
ncbi:MAG TPA: TylF/MycF/NovP-related O-methyltransferase [Pyrinomonadaceae bacterium]|nr:TylF/MycF/NovP-related O-methyltransferase [Pyrinomonadaceae bacterium]